MYYQRGPNVINRLASYTRDSTNYLRLFLTLTPSEAWMNELVFLLRLLFTKSTCVDKLRMTTAECEPIF